MRICISLTFEDIENLKKGKEVETILENHKKFPTAMQALGYKEVVEYIEGKTTKEENVVLTKKEFAYCLKKGIIVEA